MPTLVPSLSNLSSSSPNTNSNTTSPNSDNGLGNDGSSGSEEKLKYIISKSNFEQEYNKYKSNISKDVDYAKHYLFPEDLVKINDIPKTSSLDDSNNNNLTTSSVMKQVVGSISNIPHHIKEQFRYFESNHTITDYEQHGLFEKASLEKLKVRNKELHYEVDKKKTLLSSSSLDAAADTENNNNENSENDKNTNETLVYDVNEIVDNSDKCQTRIHGNLAYIKSGKQKLNKTMFVYDMCTQSLEYEWNGGAETQICRRTKDRKVALHYSPIYIELLDFLPKLFTEKFDSERIEPFFVSMSLVDLKTKSRISEEFHCDVNHLLSDESLKRLLSSTDNELNLIRNRAIFQIRDRSPDISLYIRVYKILQGDEDDSCEPYLRPEKCKDNKSKFSKNVNEYVNRMRPFIQPIAYSFVQLFESEDLVCPSEISQFYRTKGNMSDEQFFSIYSTGGGSSSSYVYDSLTNSVSKGKLKLFPATMKLKVIELSSDDYNDLKERMDKKNSIVEIDTSKYSNEFNVDSLKCTIIREMNISKLDYYKEYDNTLYVYPQQVAIGSGGLFNKNSKNISVRIELRVNDDNLDTPGLPLIFNRFNKQSTDIKTFYDYTSITYHSRHPEFNDEFKIELPTHITDKHHLLFTFIHVPCKTKEYTANKDDLAYKPHVGTILGYSMISLLDFSSPTKSRRKNTVTDYEDSGNPVGFNLGKLLSGIEQLPIYAEFSDKKGYMSERVKSTSKLYENGKPLFTVTFLPFSTIYPSDRALSHFFASLPLLINDNDMRDSMVFLQQDLMNTDIIGSGAAISSLLRRTMTDDSSVDGDDNSSPVLGSATPMLRGGGSAIMSSMNPEMIVRKYILELNDVSDLEIIHFLPSILNQLLRTVCTNMCFTHSMKNTQSAAFYAFLKVVDRVTIYCRNNGEDGGQKEDGSHFIQRNRLIKEYIEKIFINFTRCDSYVFIDLFKQWLSMLEDVQARRAKKSNMGKLLVTSSEHTEDTESKPSLVYSWVLFDLIYKSLTLYLKEKRLLNITDRSKFFLAGGNGRLIEFNNILSRFVKLLAIEVAYRSGASYNDAKIVSINFALFLRDLFNVMDRGIVLNNIEQYLNMASEQAENNGNLEVIQEFKYFAIHVIVDYEHYVPMSLPYVYVPNDKESDSDDAHVITDELQLCKNHFLCGLFIRWCIENITNKERVTRNRSTTLLRTLLTKHEYDKRYQSKEDQTSIANMYFAYVLYFMDIFHIFKKLSESKLSEIKKLVDKAKNEYQQKQNEYSKQQQELNQEQHQQQLKELEDSVQLSKKHYNDALTQFKDEKERTRLEKQQVLLSVIFIIYNMDRNLLLKWFEAESFKRKKVLFQILYMSVQVFQYSGRRKIEENHKLGIRANTNTGKSLDEAKTRLENLYTSLDRRIQPRSTTTTGRRNFKDRINFGNKNNSVRGGTLGYGTAGNTSSVNESTLPQLSMLNTRGTISGRPTAGFHSPVQLGESEKKIIDDLVLWESRLNVEISNCILSLMFDIVKKFNFTPIMELILNLQVNRKRNELELFHNIFHVLMLYFKTNQADCTYISLYYLLRVLIKKYRTTIFTSKNAEYIENLCKLVLRQCQSSLDRVRAEATALLYWMIKQNYLSDDLFNFTRTKIQLTVALSYLASEFESGVNIQLLRESFQIVSDYASADNSIPQVPTIVVKPQFKTFEIKHPKDVDEDDINNMPFGEQVKQLIERLRKTLLDTVQIEELKKSKADLESMCELYHRIASGYKHAPELSVTWFHNLAQEHIKYDRFVEASQCYIYIAGVVFEYLKLKRDKVIWGGQYCSEHKKVTELSQYLYNVSPYLRTENFAELKALFQRKKETTENQGPEFESHYFNRDGMINLLYSSIHYLLEDGYYEFVIEIYKLLLGLYEIEGNFKKLQSVYNDLSKLYSKISEPKSRSARLFGSYYKIYFFGKLFPSNLRDKEFVYKMPKTTRLNSLMEYLRNHFKFSKDLKIIADSVQITDNMKEEEEAYVQITSIKPFYSREEVISYSILNTDTYFNENVNINKFIFETPFTLGGKKSHGNITEQCKRKTIITTKLVFPSILTRSEIVDKEIKELTPIQNATEIVEGSVQRLTNLSIGYDSTPLSQSNDNDNDKSNVFRFGRILDDEFDVEEDFVPTTDQSISANEQQQQIEVTGPLSPRGAKESKANNNNSNNISSGADIGQLHLVLSGVVIPQVNEGIPHIVNSFLGPEEVHKYDSNDVNKLKEVCIDFLRACYKAILISNEYSNDNQRPLHLKFEEGYATLVQVFQRCIVIPLELQSLRK
ncbi:hypothetical protein ABK040_001877 [Willaertia magna]